MDVKKLYVQMAQSMESSSLLRAIRSGFLMILPILLLGSFSLGMRSLPIAWYQEWISGLWGGTIHNALLFLHDSTFGFLSIYIVVAMSISYASILTPTQRFSFGPPLVSISTFAICTGATAEHFEFASFGAEGMFMAILCSLLSTYLLIKLTQRLENQFSLTSDGADMEFTKSLSLFLPVTLVILFFAVVNTLLSLLFHVTSTNEIIAYLVGSPLQSVGRNLVGALLYVFLCTFLWFFGIHGSNILKNASDPLFLPSLTMHQEAVTIGEVSTEIFSREFFEVFVMLGGCGSAMCLLFSLLLFSKRKSNLRLVKFSMSAALFNINEPFLFGLPVILNPFMFVPFLITPLVLTLTTYLAMSLNLVPVATQSVLWTTPILFSGYVATGSFSGAVLQLVNLIIGIGIYSPFVLFYDQYKGKDMENQMRALVSILQDSENNLIPTSLMYLRGSTGLMAKSLSDDLRESMQKDQISIFFQPQCNQEDVCIGAEALLRWKHPQFGYIYPPLVIKLAEEALFLDDLERKIFRSVMEQLPNFHELLGNDFKMSINVSAQNIQSPRFEAFLIQLASEYPQYTKHIMIEITEQTAFSCNDVTLTRIQNLKDVGYRFALDDFSMGNTSVKYLQNNIFDLVKLDGSLVSDVTKNKRSADIIASISSLSSTLGICILAEFVETREQKELLEKLGCNWYQGYLYSPALPCEEFLALFSSAEDGSPAKIKQS